MRNDDIVFLPDGDRRALIQAMHQMIYGECPPFDALLETIAAIEADLNSL